MARPLRIEFPGAIYHVTSRGNARETIFKDVADREMFLAVLGEVVSRARWLCHGYCLMDNHYHLLVETPEANLSYGMRQLNGIYTQRFNRRHARAGHLFQGRFKAILVERERYLLELSRYIVLNPVRAKLVKDPARYPWSNYAASSGAAPSPAWLMVDWVLGRFAKTRAVAQRRYAQFVAQGRNLPSPWLELKGQVLLGTEVFVDKMRPMLRDKDKIKEIPRAQRLAHRPGLQSLFAGLRQDKPARDAAMRKAHLEYGYTLAAIARATRLHYSTVGKVIKGER